MLKFSNIILSFLIIPNEIKTEILSFPPFNDLLPITRSKQLGLCRLGKDTFCIN